MTHPVIDRRVNPGRGRRADVVVSVVGRRREVVGADGARVGPVASPRGDLVAARRRGPRAVVLAHRDLLTGCNQSTGNGLKTATPHAQVCRYAARTQTSEIRGNCQEVDQAEVRSQSEVEPSLCYAPPYLARTIELRDRAGAMIADRGGKGSRREWSN